MNCREASQWIVMGRERIWEVREGMDWEGWVLVVEGRERRERADMAQ